MKVHKLNESYSAIESSSETLIKINDFLKVERDGAWFDQQVQRGFKSPFDYFATVQNKMLLVQNGHVELLKPFGVPEQCRTPKIIDEEITEFLNTVIPRLPFHPHDFQELAFRDCLMNGKQLNKMATSSGKSLVISLIAEFFRSRGKKGLLLVPTTNLLTQFKNDIKDYNLTELYDDTHVIGGGNTDKHFDKTLTVSTWQSIQNWHDDLAQLDYVICDESHLFASEETSTIVKKTINCEYKWGFTGTIPDNSVQKMQLIGMFGLPKTYITARELIERGLATPIHINSIIFDYDKEFKKQIRVAPGYPQRLTLIKEHVGRMNFVVDLTTRVKEIGNTLVLFQHVDHGKTIFRETMKKMFPNVEVKNKDITGKKSFEFQSKHGVYFINGEDDAKTRELTRKILEKHDDAILIAGYQVLSTGVNIKRLFNLVLASPLKSYTTITQSIGRLMRLFPGKEKAQVFDLVDNTGVRTVSGPFVKQYKHRKSKSYMTEEYPIKEIVHSIKNT